MEKPTTTEAEPLSAVMVLKTVLTVAGMRGRPEQSIIDRVHMAIFHHGYKFQSRVLRIPDRYGLFSPASLDYQLAQGDNFALLIFCCTIVTVLCMLCCLFLYDRPKDVVMFVSMGVGSHFLMFIVVWLCSVTDARRKTDPARILEEGEVRKSVYNKG